MGKYEDQLKSAIHDLKSSQIDTRVRGYRVIEDLREDKHAVLDVKLLVYTVKEASKLIHQPEEIWDVPSYHLIELVTQYEEEEIVRAVIECIDAFEEVTYRLAMQYLAKFTDDFVIDAFLQSLRSNIPSKKAVFPLSELFLNPPLTIKILNQFESCLEDETYKSDYYQLLYWGLRENHYNPQYQKEKFETHILSEYQAIYPKIMEYNDSYSTKNVYRFWKETYIPIRIQADTYLSLFEYYFNENIENTLKQAITLHDPMMKSKAIIAALVQNIPVDEKELLFVATHIETAEYFQEELLRINKARLHPLQTGKQPYFALSNFFRHIVFHEEFDAYPDELRVVGVVDTHNHYKQPLRYYMISFGEEGKQPYLGFVGAYPTEGDNEGLYTWEDTHTHFVKLSDFSIEEHQTQFLQRRKEEGEVHANAVHYIGKPAWGPWLSIYGLFVVIRSLRFAELERYMQFGIFGLAAIGGFWWGYRLYERSTKRIELRGRSLVMVQGKKVTEIPYIDIRKLERKGRMICVISKKGQMLAKFPARYVDKRVFKQTITQLNMHLSDPLYLDRI